MYLFLTSKYWFKEWTMKLLLFAGPSVVVLIIFLLLLRYGVASHIRFERVRAGVETVVYEEGQGDYRKSGELMDSVYEKLIETESIETYRGFGVFYDNPKNVPVDKLRYEAGCILDGPSEATIKRLKTNFKVKNLKEGQCITTEFPFKGKLSIVLGTLRVYPALSRYIREHNLPEAGPIMEIYDVPGEKIVYRKYLE